MTFCTLSLAELLCVVSGSCCSFILKVRLLVKSFLVATYLWGSGSSRRVSCDCSAASVLKSSYRVAPLSLGSSLEGGSVPGMSSGLDEQGNG